MANLLKMSDNTFWHGNTSFYVSRNNVKYGLIDSMAEICAGTVSLGSVANVVPAGSAGNWQKNLTNKYAVTFPFTFSSVPLVIICDASQDTGYKFADVVPFVLNGSGYSGTITTTGFNVRVANMSGAARNVTISYIAIKPFQALSDTASSKTSNLKTKGSWKAPTAISTGTAIELSDSNYWSLQAVHDNRTTSSTLHDTYYTFDCGSISRESIAATSKNTYNITFNKVFAETPVVIACLYTGDISYSNCGGHLGCSVKATSPGTATLYTYNSHSAAVSSVGAKWIAFGKAEV